MIESHTYREWWREHSSWWHMTRPLLEPIADKELETINTIMVLSGPVDETAERVVSAARLARRYAIMAGHLPQLVFNGEITLFPRIHDWLKLDRPRFVTHEMSEIGNAFECLSSHFMGYSNTWTNAHMAFMQSERFASPWLIVTSDYHALRVQLTFASRFQRLEGRIKQIIRGIPSKQLAAKASQEVWKIRKYSTQIPPHCLPLDTQNRPR